MTEDKWSRMTDLFDRLLAGESPESVFTSEPDTEIRVAAMDLWTHHGRANEEEYLDSPLTFEVVPIFEPGQLLLQRFRIEGIVGKGGMGEVYLAFDQRVGDRVAIKTISRLLTQSDNVRQRFAMEVQSARRVTHPNVCRIHELFDEGKAAFFSMEFVEGESLAEWMGGPDVSHARPILRQVAEGMLAAHRMGVVHGDIKPANIMVARATAGDGVPRAVIMDFGLARALSDAGASPDGRLSLKGGTIDYMAPELQSGESPSVRSDIFAFGKIAHQLLPKEALWERCTSPNREARPASFEPIVAHLGEASTRRYWIGSLALASVGTAWWIARPAKGLKIEVPSNARILVNGFRSAIELSSVRLLRSLFLAALQQSSRIHAIDDQDALPVLRALKPDEKLPLAGQVLTDLLAKLRAAYWIDGELRQMGGRFSLDARLVATEGAHVLAANSFRDLSSVAALAQAAALWVRRVSGESDRAIELNSADLTSYTSAVPEALQKYYEAMDHYAVGEMDQAIPLLTEAVRLDAKFAQAHCMLALTANAFRRYDDGFREAELAVRLAAQLPEREREWIQMTFSRMTEDPVVSVESAQRNLAFHNDEPRAHLALGIAQVNTGNWNDGVRHINDAVRLAPEDWMTSLLLADALIEAGQPQEALEQYQSALSRGQNNPWLHGAAGTAYAVLGRYDEAITAFASAPADGSKTCDIQGARILQGHLESAIGELQEQRARARNPIELYQSNEFLCGLYFVTDRPSQALPHLREMVNLPAYPPMIRRLQGAASWARRLHDAETLRTAKGMIAEIANRWPNQLTEAMSLHAQSLEAWLGNQLDEARALLTTASGKAFSIWSIYDLAELFTQSSELDLAEAYWGHFEERLGTLLLKEWFPGTMVVAWMHHASVALAARNRATALRYSHKVLDHWASSNPRLQIVQAASAISRSN